MTLDSFMAWKTKFEQEMRTNEPKTLKDEATAKLTGNHVALLQPAFMDAAHAALD